MYFKQERQNYTEQQFWLDYKKGQISRWLIYFCREKLSLFAIDLPNIHFQIILQSYSLLALLPFHITPNSSPGVCTHLLIWHYLSNFISHRYHTEFIRSGTVATLHSKTLHSFGCKAGPILTYLNHRSPWQPREPTQGLSYSYILKFSGKNRLKPLQQSP